MTQVLFGYFRGNVERVEVSDAVGERFARARQKLGWRITDLLAWVLDRLPKGSKLTEEAVMAGLDHVERIYGLDRVDDARPQQLDLFRHE